MDNYSDEQLAERYLQGDREALNFLIKRYLLPIFNYALSLTKNYDAADDIAQEVFVKVWKKIKKFDHKYKFKAWLYVIAKNTCLDYFKKNKDLVFSSLDNQDDGLLFERLIAEAAISPQELLSVSQDNDMVKAAVDQLPDKYQQTVRMHYFQGYKFREIAGLLKESIETVKSRNRRGLQYLKKIIGSGKNAPK